MAAQITRPKNDIIPCEFVHGGPPPALKQRIQAYQLPGIDG